MDRPLAASTDASVRSLDPSSRVVDAMPDTVERVRLVPDALIPGTRYRIVGWLGEGAMGTVYEARHVDIDRTVAIKVLHPEHSTDARELDRFRAEARAASNIGSPWIVDVFDFDELPDGRMYYVMERLRGRGLDSEVMRAPIDLGRLVGILRQICKGMAAAHAAGIVHRDLKPANVIVLDPGERDAQGRSDRIKLLDFGIAAIVGQRADLLGTPAYMAPEQLRREQVGASMDIYALGCAAYELVCGQPPFVGSAKEVLRQHLRATPAAPSTCAQIPVPPALDRVILRCLAKSPDERYPDMRELEAALCEAQLEAGLTTPWDDLPLPEIAEDRRRRLAERFAALAARTARPRRPLVWSVVAIAIVLLLGAMWAMRPAPAPALDVVERLSREARDAAAGARFVYPPPDAPDASTAYAKVLELEALRGDEREAARTEARSLRQELAHTLVSLGDRYWQIDGGQPFAIDYYAQALLFDDRESRARERGGLTPGQLADLRRKAEERAFSPVELEAAEPLAIMAETDETRRSERLASFQARARPRSVVADARLEALEPAIAPARNRAKPRVADPEPAPRAAPIPSAAPDVAATTPVPTGSSRTRAQELARDGRRVLERGQWRDAEQLFHAALEQDRHCAAALIGLSDLHFEQSAYAKAAKFAEQAVREAPKNAGHRIKLGDAYFRQLRYAEARQAYEHARRLGHADAAGRLRRLDALVGKKH